MTDLFTTAAAQLTAWAKIIGGQAWGADKGKPRIYMSSRKDCKIYFEFPDFPTGDEANLLGGAAFKCFIDDCGQHSNWYASQRQKMLERHFTPSLALTALNAGDEQLARDIMERGDVDAAELNEAAGHLINGRLEEARKIIGK